MMTEEAQRTIQTLNVRVERQIAAPIEIVFQTVLEPHGPMSEMSLKLEAWPGGRWYRDLGNNTGHFWGHVQVIKPPTLLEITGPMFMSYPVASHINIASRRGPAGRCCSSRIRRWVFSTPSRWKASTTDGIRSSTAFLRARKSRRKRRRSCEVTRHGRSIPIGERWRLLQLGESGVQVRIAVGIVVGIVADDELPVAVGKRVAIFAGEDDP